MGEVRLLPAAFERPRLRFMTCGSVDDGKSTVIGRLLYDSGAIFEDQETEARGAGGGGDLDFSLLVDGLKAEREQGITIDVAYRYFTTDRRAFLIADAPGHEQYTRNQAAAASQAQLAVVLVSAPDGVQPQTRRHMAIASMFGVRSLVLAVNKMDLVGYDRGRFTTLRAQLETLAGRLGLAVAAAIPISARGGDNVVRRSAAMAWHSGPTLLDVLEGFEPPQQASTRTLLPVALTGRLPAEAGAKAASSGRVSYGELASGTVSVGQRLTTEAGIEATVTKLWQAGTPVELAEAGAPLALALAPERDIGRGAVLSAAGDAVAPVAQARVRFVWLSPEPLHSARSYQLAIGCGETRATLSAIEGQLELESLTLVPASTGIGINDVAVGLLNFLQPLPALPFGESRTLGAFILIERASRRTAAAGVVLAVERLGRDTPWQAMEITPADRARQMGQTPVVIWLTGLSGAGKSTIADLLDRRLYALGHHATVLDGDNLRHGLSADLGFSAGDRSENIRRVGEVAALMADAGLIVIVSLISPFRDDRQRAREVVGAERFIEVFVDAPLSVCQERDPKGMYARARSGNLAQFTGVTGAYEPPEAPDVHLRTDQTSPEQALALVLEALRRR